MKFVVQLAVKETYSAVYEGNIFPNDMDVSVTMKFVEAEDPTWGAGLLFWSKGLKDLTLIAYGPKISYNLLK